MTKKQDQDESIEKIEDENIEATEQEVPEDDLETQLEAAQQSAKDNWDKVLRAQAEMENLKRRNAKDLENAHKFALDGFVKALLVSNCLILQVKRSIQNSMKLLPWCQCPIKTLIRSWKLFRLALL